MKSLSATETKKKASQVFKKPPFLKLIYISIFLNLICILGIIAIKQSLPPEAPLFYGLAEGEDQLTTTLGLTLPGVASIFIVLINLLIATFIENELLRKSLIIAGFFVSVLSFITTIQIVLLIGAF